MESQIMGAPKSYHPFMGFHFNHHPCLKMFQPINGDHTASGIPPWHPMTIKTSIWDCSSPSQRAGSCQANPEFDVGPMAPIFWGANSRYKTRTCKSWRTHLSELWKEQRLNHFWSQWSNPIYIVPRIKIISQYRCCKKYPKISLSSPTLH